MTGILRCKTPYSSESHVQTPNPSTARRTRRCSVVECLRALPIRSPRPGKPATDGCHNTRQLPPLRCLPGLSDR